MQFSPSEGAKHPPAEVNHLAPGNLPNDVPSACRLNSERPIVEKPAQPQSWQIPVALASILMGVLVSLQFRWQTGNKPVSKTNELITMVKNLEGERDKLTADLQAARGRLGELEQKLGQDNGYTQELTKQVSEARAQAGLTAMKGPGIIVTMTDSNRRPGPDEDAYFFAIHDADLQTLVNELFAAGAEAVSINDQRIITRTSIRCVGPSVLVNTVQLASPFVVKGIGVAKELEGGLRMPQGFLDSMAMLIRSGGEVKIVASSEVQVPAFSGSMSFRHAVPVPDTPKNASVGATQP